MKPRVFISYASEDRNLRDRLVEELARWGIHVWSDKKLQAGKSFNESIASALYESRALVLISTGDSLRSDYVNAEVKFAQKLRKQICEVSVAGNHHPDLTDIQRVEFRGVEDWSEIVGELSATLKRSIGPSEIFIAHDFGDDPDQEEFLEWAATELAEQGLDVWFEGQRIGFGDDRQELTRDAIDRAGVVLAVLSRQSASSLRFCEHVMRALVQDDEVLVIIYRDAETTREELFTTWEEAFSGVLAGVRFEEVIRARFDRMIRLEPARFIDGEKDAQLMAQVAKGLRKRQEKFKPDEKVEREASRVFEEFTKTMQEMGLDAAEVLNLPEYKAETLTQPGEDIQEAARAVGESPAAHGKATPAHGGGTVIDFPGQAEPATQAAPTSPAATEIPKFCRICGTRTVTKTKFCRKCGSPLAAE